MFTLGLFCDFNKLNNVKKKIIDSSMHVSKYNDPK